MSDMIESYQDMISLVGLQGQNEAQRIQASYDVWSAAIQNISATIGNSITQYIDLNAQEKDRAMMQARWEAEHGLDMERTELDRQQTISNIEIARATNKRAAETHKAQIAEAEQLSIQRAQEIEANKLKLENEDLADRARTMIFPHVVSAAGFNNFEDYEREMAGIEAAEKLLYNSPDPRARKSITLIEPDLTQAKTPIYQKANQMIARDPRGIARMTFEDLRQGVNTLGQPDDVWFEQLALAKVNMSPEAFDRLKNRLSNQAQLTVNPLDPQAKEKRLQYAVETADRLKRFDAYYKEFEEQIIPASRAKDAERAYNYFMGQTVSPKPGVPPAMSVDQALDSYELYRQKLQISGTRNIFEESTNVIDLAEKAIGQKPRSDQLVDEWAAKIKADTGKEPSLNMKAQAGALFEASGTDKAAWETDEFHEQVGSAFGMPLEYTKRILRELPVIRGTIDAFTENPSEALARFQLNKEAAKENLKQYVVTGLWGPKQQQDVNSSIATMKEISVTRKGPEISVKDIPISLTKNELSAIPAVDRSFVMSRLKEVKMGILPDLSMQRAVVPETPASGTVRGYASFDLIPSGAPVGTPYKDDNGLLAYTTEIKR